MNQSTKPRLILHIGAGKTGTSAIEDALQKNHSLLRDRGILVPDTKLGVGPPTAGGHVLTFERVRPVTQESMDVVQEKLLALSLVAVDNGWHTVIISAENLINAVDFARLFRHADEANHVRVIAFIRRQDDYAFAAWSQV